MPEDENGNPAETFLRRIKTALENKAAAMLPLTDGLQAGHVWLLR